MRYPYAEGNLLASPHTYFFSQVGGQAFVEAYLKNRLDVLLELQSRMSIDSHQRRRINTWLFEYWGAWNGTDAGGTIPDYVLTFMKRFAVTKKVWTDYAATIRPTEHARSDDLAAYCEVMHLALSTARVRKDLRFLNVALQIGDLISAHRSALTDSESVLAFTALVEEIAQVVHLIHAARP